MTFEFCLKRYDTHYTTEQHTNSMITYYSKHKMVELYPNGSYEVIGEIGNYAKRYSEQDEILTGGNKKIPIFPRGSSKKPFEWVVGYAAVAENTYVAVIKSIIPRLLYDSLRLASSQEKKDKEIRKNSNRKD
jgi:hypothetical protein